MMVEGRKPFFCSTPFDCSQFPIPFFAENLMNKKTEAGALKTAFLPTSLVVKSASFSFPSNYLFFYPRLSECTSSYFLLLVCGNPTAIVPQ